MQQDVRDDSTCGKRFPPETETYRICRAQLARLHAIEQKRKPADAADVEDDTIKAGPALR